MCMHLLRMLLESLHVHVCMCICEEKTSTLFGLYLCPYCLMIYLEIIFYQVSGILKQE